jgi:hypothetical protein
MKAHIGVDSWTKLIHAAVATPANVADSTVLPDLLHGRETRVWGDQAYRGQRVVIRVGERISSIVSVGLEIPQGGSGGGMAWPLPALANAATELSERTPRQDREPLRDDPPSHVARISSKRS